MRYHVLHETGYQYAAPVLVSHQMLHLAPRALDWQTTLSHRVTIDPEPGEWLERADYYGNTSVLAVFLAPHEKLSVRAESEVEVGARAAQARLAASTPWETVRDVLRGPAAGGEAVAADEAIVAADFVFDSLHAGADRALARYAARSFAPGRPVHEAACDLAVRIHREFEFDPKATSIATPLAEVLKMRRGVCQDFAHLMIGCLRTLGLAARYVSGYILTAPPPGKPRLVGADASHAWVAVWCPRQGWVDLDPTNACVVDDEHVTLAWGRDFDDVTPMRGVILGGGEQALEVRVTVTPMAG